MTTTSFTKKTLGLETVEPAVTPPPSSTGETTFTKKPKISNGKSKKRDIPEGLWVKCKKCANLVYDKELDESLKVCPRCQYHFQLGARDRIQSLADAGSFVELDANLVSVDILGFAGTASYISKLADNQKKTGEKDAVITGLAKIGGHPVALACMDFSFIGGSMGSVVGEKITRLIERGTADQLPVIVVSTSGGARMYEGMFSLMQMAKTCGALAYLAAARIPYISVLTHNTYAGVMASYASVGDLILAEPGAEIGFAGARVIKDTTQAELPAGFQTAEFLLEHGLIDAVIHRKDLKKQLAEYLDFLMAAHHKDKEAAPATA